MYRQSKLNPVVTEIHPDIVQQWLDGTICLVPTPDTAKRASDKIADTVTVVSYLVSSIAAFVLIFLVFM